MDAVPMAPPMVTTGGLAGLSLAEAADAFARGAVTATALTRACLERIEAHEPVVNATT